MKTTDSTSLYSELALGSIPRVLSRLDRNPYSQTYGCFDWLFWHDKVHDIPSGHDQEMMYILAILYSKEFPSNIYYQNFQIRNWIMAAAKFWSSILHADGSLDEFYPFERQYGATAITAWAAAETFRLIQEDLSMEERGIFLESLKKSGKWLSHFDEPTAVANHQAQALMALYRIHQITRQPLFEGGWKKKYQRLMGLYHGEGWFEEYGGFDPGYQTTTLSFLANFYQETHDPRLKLVLDQCFKLMSYCIVPHGHFGGIIGSRNTTHVWPFAFEQLASENPTAAVIAQAIRENFCQGRYPTPKDQDRYFGQQVYNFLETATMHTPAASIRTNVCLPKDGPDFSTYFKDCGLFFIKESDNYLIVNCKKGGSFYFSSSNPNLSVLDNGSTFETQNGDIVSSSLAAQPQVAYDATPIESGSITSIRIQGRATYINTWLPKTGFMILFRLLCLIQGLCSVSSVHFRHLLAKIVITRQKLTSIEFERHILLSSDLIIRDIIRNTGKIIIKKGTLGGFWKNIYVPYAKCFLPDELQTNLYDWSDEQVALFNQKREITIERRIKKHI